jgi:phage baseplate assembly protein W
MPLYGPEWPLKSGNKDVWEMYEDLNQQINFYLKNLLMTSPGENISDQNYGVGIRQFLFEQNVESIRSSIATRISTQIAIYLSYISVVDIQVGASSQEIDANSMYVRIIYTVPNDVNQQVFELDLAPDTTIGFY